MASISFPKPHLPTARRARRKVTVPAPMLHLTVWHNGKGPGNTHRPRYTIYYTIYHTYTPGNSPNSIISNFPAQNFRALAFGSRPREPSARGGRYLCLLSFWQVVGLVEFQKTCTIFVNSSSRVCKFPASDRLSRSPSARFLACPRRRRRPRLLASFGVRV